MDERGARDVMNFESCPTLFYPCVVSMYSTPALGIYPSLVGLQTLPLKITPSFSNPQPPPSLNSPSAFSSSLSSRFMSVTLRFGGTQDAQKAMGLLLHDKLFLVCVSVPFYGGVCFFNWGRNCWSFQKVFPVLVKNTKEISHSPLIPHKWSLSNSHLHPVQSSTTALSLLLPPPLPSSPSYEFFLQLLGQ